MMYEHFTFIIGKITDQMVIKTILDEYVKRTYGEHAKYQLIRSELRPDGTGIFFSVNRKHQKTHVAYDSCGGNRRRHTRV